MIYFKKFLYIDNIQQLNLDYIKKTKAKIILRNSGGMDIKNYEKFVSQCKSRRIDIAAYNDIKILFKFKLNILYVSSYNKRPFKYLKKIKNRLKIVGSAHNKIEINEKINQGCDEIIVSRLFKTSKEGFLNISKFNLLVSGKNNIIALGGINEKNYKKLKLVNIKGYAVLSDLKNYPKYLVV